MIMNCPQWIASDLSKQTLGFELMYQLHNAKHDQTMEMPGYMWCYEFALYLLDSAMGRSTSIDHDEIVTEGVESWLKKHKEE